jgi:hypothetical protein
MRDSPERVVRTPVAWRAQVPLARLISHTYLMLGILGLLYTGFDFFSNVTGVSFLGFTVNPLTNVIHIGVGMVGIPMALTPWGARAFLRLIGILGVPFAVTGLVVQDTLSDFFARNPALVWTHLGTAIVALLAGFAAVGDPPPDERGRPRQPRRRWLRGTARARL